MREQEERKTKPNIAKSRTVVGRRESFTLAQQDRWGGKKPRKICL